MKTIDMQDIRHLNLFGKITQVKTRHCFKYNNMIIFCVPKNLVSKSIGENGKNIRKINEILKRRIKVIPEPHGIGEMKKFVENIVEPLAIKSLDVNGNEIIVTAIGQNKAMLIGRNKTKLYELQKISKDFFGKNLSIV